MKAISKLLPLVASLMLFGALPSQAVPLEDQGIHTYDPNTGLQWRDVNDTQGLSYADVSAELGVGGAYEGYRYATGAEIGQLFINAGITPTLGSSQPTRSLIRMSIFYNY